MARSQGVDTRSHQEKIVDCMRNAVVNSVNGDRKNWKQLGIVNTGIQFNGGWEIIVSTNHGDIKVTFEEVRNAPCMCST